MKKWLIALCFGAIASAPEAALAANRQSDMPFWQRLIAAVLPSSQPPQQSAAVERHSRHRHPRVTVAGAVARATVPYAAVLPPAREDVGLAAPGAAEDLLQARPQDREDIVFGPAGFEIDNRPIDNRPQVAPPPSAAPEDGWALPAGHGATPRQPDRDAAMWAAWAEETPPAADPAPSAPPLPRAAPRQRDRQTVALAAWADPNLAAAVPAPDALPVRTRPLASDGCNGGQRITSAYYWEGRHTASGAPFDPRGMTAAHRTLPFGTRLTVSNPRTGQSVIVVINDRGPFVRGISLDLSLAAAKAIGMHGTGTVCIL